MRRHQFEAYLDKVFDFSEQVAALPEGRHYPRHPWKKVFDAVFLGAACQFANLHQIEAECRGGVFLHRIGPLSEDTMGYTLQRQDPGAVFTLGCEVARRLNRNGVLRSDWARGRVVVAADGIEICSSFVRCCETCLERRVIHKVDGALREDIQYYHRITVTRNQADQKGRLQQTVVEQGANFYASNVELGSIPPLFIHRLGRSRWQIDADVLQTLTTDGHLKKPSVHQNRGRALVVLTPIRVLAYTLTMVFDHRQVRTHFRKVSFGFCDLARRLAYWFLVPRLDSS